MTDQGRYRDALANPEFRAIFLAHIVSMLGGTFAQLALTVLVYARTGSPLLSALTFTMGFVPHLIAGTLLSALVDRVSTRKLLVTCNLLSMVTALAMTLPGTPVWALLALALALGMIRPVFLGARSATMPDVLSGPSYVPGRSLMRLVAQGSQVGGFAASGVLLTVVSPRALLLGNAIAFAAAALLLRFGTRERVPEPQELGTPRPSLPKDSMAGVRAVLSVPPLRRILLVGWAVPAFAVTPEALAVPYAASLSAGSLGAGILLTAIPLGTVVGEVLTNWLVPADRQARLVAVAAAVTFVPLLCFVVRPGILVATVVLFVSGLGASCHLGLDRLLLDTAPPQLRARALSIQAAGLMFWQGVAFGVAGAAAEFAPPTIVIPVAAGCGLLAVTLYVITRSPLSSSSTVAARGPDLAA